LTWYLHRFPRWRAWVLSGFDGTICELSIKTDLPSRLRPPWLHPSDVGPRVLLRIYSQSPLLQRYLTIPAPQALQASGTVITNRSGKAYFRAKFNIRACCQRIGAWWIRCPTLSRNQWRFAAQSMCRSVATAKASSGLHGRRVSPVHGSLAPTSARIPTRRTFCLTFGPPPELCRKCYISFVPFSYPVVCSMARLLFVAARLKTRRQNE